MVLPTPASDRFFPEGKGTKTQYGKKQYTKAEQILEAQLSSHKIPFKNQVSFTRQGEVTKEGIPKVYIADCVINNLVFELEGPRTSSDNMESDRFFKKNGYHVIHIPNALAIKYGDVLGALIDGLYNKLKKDVTSG